MLTAACLPETLLYLQSPQWVAGVGASVEKAAGLCSCTEQVLCWKTLGLRDVTNLEEKENTNRTISAGCRQSVNTVTNCGP